jgi:hypothetical protein
MLDQEPHGILEWEGGGHGHDFIALLVEEVADLHESFLLRG